MRDVGKRWGFKSMQRISFFHIAHNFTLVGSQLRKTYVISSPITALFHLPDSNIPEHPNIDIQNRSTDDTLVVTTVCPSYGTPASLNSHFPMETGFFSLAMYSPFSHDDPLPTPSLLLAWPNGSRVLEDGEVSSSNQFLCRLDSMQVLERLSA